MVLARLLLQREALMARVRRGGPIEISAGLPRGREVDRLVECLLPEVAAGGAAVTGDRRQPRIDEIAAAFDGPVSDARRALAADLAGDGVFAVLAANAGLDAAGAEVLGLACAIEVDPVLQRLVAWLHDDPAARRLTLGLVDRLVGPVGLRAVAPGGALIRAGYATVESLAPSWSSQPVVLAPAVVWTILGDRSRDPDLPADLEIHVSTEPGERDARLVLVHGGDHWARRQAATAVAPAHRFLVAAPPASAPGWQALVREATMLGSGLVIDLVDGLDAAGRSWVERADHLVWVLSSPGQLPLTTVPRRPWRELEAVEGTAGPELWASLVPGAEAGRHPLTAGQLHQVAQAIDAVDGDLDAAVRRLASGAIDRLASRIRPRRTWADLVVPDSRRAQLGEVAARYRHRALVHGRWGYDRSHAHGIVALFHGPSGTGKTLSAEIIAHDLGLDLFRIDLSAMVSKYIGETEKNLEELFDAAAAANVVLLFDEADSLFGKRSEISDAKDRYANVEVSYLLQRIERYDGVVVLTTNLLKNIDQAFLRRIDVLVEYALPDPEERLALWRLGFPPGAPLADDVDLDLLAQRFKLAGGNIHSVTLTAAFLAAEVGTAITLAHVIEALGREYTKLGRLRTAEEFGPWLT